MLLPVDGIVPDVVGVFVPVLGPALEVVVLPFTLVLVVVVGVLIPSLVVVVGEEAVVDTPVVPTAGALTPVPDVGVLMPVPVEPPVDIPPPVAAPPLLTAPPAPPAAKDEDRVIANKTQK